MLDRSFASQYPASWVGGEPKKGFPGPRVWGKSNTKSTCFAVRSAATLRAMSPRE